MSNSMRFLIDIIRQIDIRINVIQPDQIFKLSMLFLQILNFTSSSLKRPYPIFFFLLTVVFLYVKWVGSSDKAIMNQHPTFIESLRSLLWFTGPELTVLVHSHCSYSVVFWVQQAAVFSKKALNSRQTKVAGDHGGQFSS